MENFDFEEQDLSPINDYLKPKEPILNAEKELIKTERGLIAVTKDKEPPRSPDFIGDDHDACAWISQRNPDGEIIRLNVKIGDFRFKLRKRFI